MTIAQLLGGFPTSSRSKGRNQTKLRVVLWAIKPFINIFSIEFPLFILVLCYLHSGAFPFGLIHELNFVENSKKKGGGDLF